MTNFPPACINKKNTKYFRYLRFLIIGIIAIPVIFIFFRATTIVEAQPGGLEGTISGTVDPIHASTTINVSGTIKGNGTDTGEDCTSFECPPLDIINANYVFKLEYKIDNGSWTDITGSMVQTSKGLDTDCGGCTDWTPYYYDYSRNINISSLPQGNHTINVRATSGDMTIWETGNMAFDNIPFDFNIAPEVDSGSVYQSGSHSVGIRIGRLQGPATRVDVSASGNPANSTITFSPTNYCTPNDECTVTMNIQTQASTPTGTYPITITGTSPSQTHTATYTLTVDPMPPLIVDVAADPSTGLVPLNDVGIIVDTGGTATGLLNIQIDCAYDGISPTFDFTLNGTASTSYYYGPTTGGSGCDYPSTYENSYVVLARVTRAGNTEENTTMVTTRETNLDECAQKASGGSYQLDAGITETWATSSIEVYEASGTGPSLRGGFYEMDFSCTECNPQDTTDFRTGIVTAFEYRFDNTGTWTPLNRFPVSPFQWDVHSETGLNGCYVWTGCCLQEQYMYNMYWFDFALDVSALSVGNHALNLRAREEWNHDGGFTSTGHWFDPYYFVNTFYQSISFSKNGSPGIELVFPENSSYVSSGNPDPIFSARVTDPNINQPLFAHFHVVGFGEESGSTTTAPGISEWGPVAGTSDGAYIWRAYAEDSVGATSSWSEYWVFTKDTIAPTAVIDQENGISADTDIAVRLTEDDERSGVREGDVDVSWRLIGNPTWEDWVNNDLPNNGSIIDDFVYPGVRGYEYQFRYRVSDNAGNWSDYVYDGTVAIPFNSSPTVSDLSFSNSDFCSSSPAYFFSWVYSDADGDTQSRFDFQIDDSGDTFPSPEVNRSYSGLSNPSPTINNQAVTVLISQQADHLTYNRTYNWRVRVYDSNNFDSGWVNGTVFTTPSHRSPVCNFSWSPVNPKPNELTDFFDSSTCYDTGGNAIPCVGWNWTFVDGDPAVSIQQSPSIRFSSSGTKNVTLEVTDSFGSACSLTGQVIVNLLPGRWKEVKP